MDWIVIEWWAYWNYKKNQQTSTKPTSIWVLKMTSANLFLSFSLFYWQKQCKKDSKWQDDNGERAPQFIPTQALQLPRLLQQLLYLAKFDPWSQISFTPFTQIMFFHYTVHCFLFKLHRLMCLTVAHSKNVELKIK